MAELNITKRGKTWQYRFEGAKIEGKRNQLGKGGYKTKKECLEAGTKALAEYNNSGQYFEPSQVSLADFLDYWLDNHVKKNLDHNTYLDYESKIRIHIKPHLGIYRLPALQPSSIQEWIDDMKLRGYARSMVKNTLSCLSGALNYAVIPCQFIKANPCYSVSVPKMKIDVKRKEHTEYICNKEEYEKILERWGPSTNFYLPLVVGYNLGTRIGETYGFDLLSDVDFENHKISINHQLKKEYKTWFLGAPKYDSYRIIKIGQTLEEVLKKEIIKRKENMLRYGSYYMKTYVMADNSVIQLRANMSVPYKEIMPLSVKENGELLTPESFKYCARVIHNELGNALFHSHSLRHTHGTILAENGVNPKTIMERLGHKDIKVTLQTYVFNTEKMQDDAVTIFEKAIK